MTPFDSVVMTTEIGLTITLGGISKGLIEPKDNLSRGEIAAAVAIESAAISVLSQAIAASCDDCQGTGKGTEKSGADHCYCCLGSGKLLDQSVSSSLSEIVISMYNLDYLLGDYLAVAVKNVIVVAGVITGEFPG